MTTAATPDPNILDARPKSPAAPLVTLAAEEVFGRGRNALPLATTRAFDDAAAARKAIYDNVLTALASLPPLENDRYRLELADVRYVDPEERSLRERKEAILRGDDLVRRVKGTWVLRDARTGAVLQKRRGTIARVPHLTDDGTFVLGGSEVSLANQLRLRPGIYTRIKHNGELEAHVNALPGHGVSHRYQLDPESGVFRVEIGQARIPLISLLRAMGVTDQELRQAWGDDLFRANVAADRGSYLDKLYARFVPRGRAATPEEKQAALAQAIASVRLDPAVTRRTLGEPAENLSVPLILRATQKLLAVRHGKEEPDDRDHLAFQVLYGPEELLAERIARDYGGIRRKFFRKVASKGSLDAIPPGALTAQLLSAIRQSGLGMNLEEINAADILDKMTRVTRMGEGGIPSIDAIPDEARALQPSHLGFIDPIRTPESLKAGVDLFMSRAARKGPGGELVVELHNVRSNRRELVGPEVFFDHAIAFPGELRRPGKYAAAMKKGKIQFVPKTEVDYVLPHFENAMSALGNLIPLKSAMDGKRGLMASRMLGQAVPLVHREAPLVQSGVPEAEDQSFEELYAARFGALRAPQSGVVKEVHPDRIVVAYDDGTKKTHELYCNFPYNRKTLIHQEPAVKPGQRVEAGQLLATSNHTDASGTLALGVNARVAFLPWKGYNHADAFVISESFAKKLTSEHAYQHRVDWRDDLRRGKSAVESLFPGRYDKRQLGNLDDAGVAKPGTVLQPGDPVILAARYQPLAPSRSLRKKTTGFSDASVVWDHKVPGVVTDAFSDERGATVVVKALMPMQVADKLSDRMGGKGIVAAILPDDQMPILPDGKPAEVVQNPAAILSRANPAAIIETALGKIAAKTGRPYKVRDFEDIEDLAQFALDELRRHGVKDYEYVIDPETGRKIPNVLVGNRFYMKLHHTAESKGQARGTGAYSSMDEPAKGGETGAKRIALLELGALLSHGAYGVLQDASLVRGQRNDDFWLAFMRGANPPKPKVPLIYQRFVNELKAAGINVVQGGDSTRLMALTDKDVEELAGRREIANAETLDPGKDMKPVPGGLFDPSLFGGQEGNRWAYFRLHEPMPNPIMEEPIRRLLGLTEKEFREVLAGRSTLPGGLTGPKGIQKALAEIDVPREIVRAKADILSKRGSARDAAVRRLSFLRACEDLGIHPAGWMLSKVPVLPPRFRPVSMLPTGTPLVADANYLYKQLFDANKTLAELSRQVEDISDERLAVYDAFRELVGLDAPSHPKLAHKGVRGLLRTIFGDSPKTSLFQARILSSNTDLVGRATVAPDPDLSMDEVGLPENRAWEVYKPFVVRRLRRAGLPLLRAAQEFENRTALARRALEEEMHQRPVIINRAPVLHRFGILAFWPRLVPGDVLKVSPLVIKGFNMDFDGDAVQYHVPVSAKAVEEAVQRMLPSKNLLSPADFKSPVHVPTEEFAAAIYAATRAPDKKQRPAVFQDVQAVRDAYLRGEISYDTPVEILSVL